jgi:hypothetical protein
MVDGIGVAGSKITIDGTDIAYVTNYSSSGYSRETSDATHLLSTIKQSIPSIPIGGEMSFDVLFDPANTTQTGLYDLMDDKLEKSVVLTFSSLSTMTFDGYVTDIGFDGGGIDETLTGSITVTVNSKPVFA